MSLFTLIHTKPSIYPLWGVVSHALHSTHKSSGHSGPRMLPVPPIRIHELALMVSCSCLLHFNDRGHPIDCSCDHLRPTSGTTLAGGQSTLLDFVKGSETLHITGVLKALMVWPLLILDEPHRPPLEPVELNEVCGGCSNPGEKILQEKADLGLTEQLADRPIKVSQIFLLRHSALLLHF